jgi:hypothetical protein
MTTSMQAATSRGPRRYLGARESAGRLLAALPPDTPVGIRAIGVTPSESCVETTHLAAGSVGELGQGVRSHLRALRPRSEGSLAGALQTVVERPNGPLDRTRVVIFSDLGSECGGDLCAAGSALAAAGARLEFVLLADAALPGCLSKVAPQPAPRIASTPPALVQPEFRIESHDVDSRQRGPVLVRGRADGERLRLSPQHVLIVVEMDPPALIGPIALEPNGHTHIHILDFPSLDPPVREWGWTIEPISGPVAAPPPPAESTPGSKPTEPVRDRAVAQSG